MDDAEEGSRPTRREVLGATAGALAVGALPGRSGAQQASGPTVYVGSNDGTLYAVDAATGSEEWPFSKPDRPVFSSPTVYEGTVYVGSNDNRLYAVDAATGTQQWVFTQQYGNIASSPTVYEGTVYVGSADGTLYAVEGGTGSKQWTFTEPNDPIFSSPTVMNGSVYVGSDDGTLYAVDADSGNKQWVFSRPDASVGSSPTVYEGTVYVGSDDGTLYAVDAGTGSEEWAFTEPDGGVGSSPTVLGRTVYVGSADETLYAVDTATGTKQWAFTRPDDVVFSSPTVYEGTVYVGSDDNTLYAVEAATGTKEWVFTQPEARVGSSPTVVEEPQDGDSIGSRVRLGTLGHYGDRADATTPRAPAFFEVTIEETTEPAVGETLDVIVAVENTGEQSDTQTVSLTAAGLGSDSTEVSPAGGESTTETLSLQTSDGDAGNYTGTVSTDDDSAQQTVTVVKPAAFTVDITDTNNPAAGGPLEVTLAVENTGDSQGSQTLKLDVPGLGSDSKDISLDTEASTEPILSVPTAEDDAGEYTATVESDDDSEDQTVTVREPAALTVDITDTTDPVAGDPLEVTVAVENTGDEAGTQIVELSAPGLGSDSMEVDLDGGESITGELSFSTDEGNAGEYTVTARVGGDEATRMVTVSEPAGDGRSSSEGSLGMTEMAAIGGGGGLALLFGAYALMRRGGDDSDGTGAEPTPMASNGSGTTRGDAGASTPRQPPDSSLGDTVDSLLDDVTGTLDSARRARDSGAYDRALAHCREAIDTAEEARATAREDAPDRVPDAEAALDNATVLREAIQVERDARRRASDALDHAERALDNAAGALDGGRLDDVFDHLDDARAALADAGDAIADHDPPNLADRLAALEQRQERLRQAAEDAITRTPATIPTTPRYSLSYDDIEKGDPLGSGGNADVYHATATADGEQVDIALKEPRMGGTLHIETVERMMQEAETWQRLDDHDHIVGVVDYGSEPLPWIAMEHMDAGHLGERADELDFEQSLWTAIATTKAVRHAHRRGVAHLDLKPENILFRRVADAWDAPKVADWGLSKHLLDHSKSVEGMTVEYAAPEQFDDEYGAVDDITDVYQLGAVFYELFTGRPPFEGQPFEVMNRIQNEEPDPPSAVADVPAELDETLLRAMATEKQDRYEDVLLLRNDLQTLSEEIAGGF